MENSKKAGGSSFSSSSSSSSSATNFDQLFGPRDPSTTSSSSTGLFNSIFPPPSAMRGRDSHTGYQAGGGKYGSQGYTSKGEDRGTTSKDKNSIYQNETAEPSYLSSSIYYGGQENYSPRTRTNESHQYFKKDDKDDDSDGGNPNSASRGNWWQGSLYY